MGFFSKLVKKVGKAVGIDPAGDAANARKKAEAEVAKNSAFANKDVRASQDRMRMRQKSKGRGRGRDSTIITSGSEIQSRTLLG